MTDDPTVRLETSDAVARIILNRPDRLNAFDATMAREWTVATRAAVDDPAVRVIVIRAEGRAFCAGGDVRAMAAGGDAVEGGVERLAGVINEGISVLVGSSVPVIAAAHGTTAGGGLGILLASDYAVVGSDSRIGSLYADMGLTPDLSVTAQLARAVGERRALQLVLSPRLLSADEAYAWGLVAEVVDPADVGSRAEAVARVVADGASSAYGQAKRLIRSQPTRTFEEQLAEEARTIGAALTTGEAQARIAAFAAKAARA